MRIAAWFVALGLSLGVTSAGAQVSIDTLVTRFYLARSFQPAWVSPSGLSAQAMMLLDAVAQSEHEGLEPANYVEPELNALLFGASSPGSAWQLDMLLTRTFFTYARDLSRGRIDPALVDAQWMAAPDSIDFVGALDEALADNRLAAVLHRFAPPQAGYAGLRAALERYRDLARLGEWPGNLGRRLAAEGYDTTPGLAAAVLRFQALHGLAQDGIVGPATRAELDVPAAVRVRQIVLTMERWRWLPRSLGERYMVVNSAAFSFELVEDDTVTFATPAIVGRPDWPTPIVSAQATSILFRPSWVVPKTIATQEIFPLLARNPGYLGREGFRMLSDSQLVQEPGGSNPLGGLKLVFWTPFSVFIHDTPGHSAFSESWRAFSHGCVRIDNAADLAGRLLPSWPAESIHAAMTTGDERWVRLPQPIPVHLVYWTAWAADDGLIGFAPDLYGWDAELARRWGFGQKEIT